MPKGKPTRWATASVLEPLDLGRRGIEIVVWDKWGRKRTGTLVVSVGGLRWFPYKAKKPSRLSWPTFMQTIESLGRIA